MELGADSERSTAAELSRRALDVAVASVLLVLTLPVLLLVLLGCAISLRANPIFVQERVGHRGRPFRFLKVRTLPLTAPAYTDKHHLDLKAVPAFCRLVRNLHLDEIPQLLLVLIGRMSLVGPRPEMRCLHDTMDPDFATRRTSVRPGCTGIWQVSEASRGLIRDAPAYDDFYLEHRTLRLDAWILYRTARKMLGARRPVDLSAVPSWALRQPDAVTEPAPAR